ncbi:nickel transporter permease [Sporohalobacter salinus]|uniref:nickel transporter permease n=1 Tax=Sporohalobacter salinus TaxID=1494606 RepID=UPI00195F2FA2|nr:nickel transporter permease [Sporohalobacter salinus]MBM7624403.1 peptide/nickel transport system permease protein [Sporohalobacter salinus]
MIDIKTKDLKKDCQSVFKRLTKNKLAFLGFIIILLFVLVGIFAPYLAPNNPNKLNLEHRLSLPTVNYPFGTDHLGRCVFSRIIYGTRISIFTSLLMLFVIIFISVPVGIVSGYIGGKVDSIIMRIIDVFLAFPSILLAIVIAGFLGPSLVNTMIALASVWWVRYVRVIRGKVLSIKQKDFIIANKACGTSDLNIIIRHIIPNISSTIIVLATIDMGELILSLSGLSFLGLGAQPPTPEWGVMLSESRDYMQVASWGMIFPGATIMTASLAFNLFGDGLRDVLDPRSGIKR